MASALIQSNAQSALIATLNSASGASVNPFEYTLSKRVPSHGVQWTKLEAVNPGALSAGSTLSFDLTKMGITRSCTFQCDVECAAEANHHIGTSGTGWLNIIDHIDLESSSRRVLTMSREAILCAYSDLPYEQRQAFERGCRMTRNPDTGAKSAKGVAADGTNRYTFYIPLLFSCFDNGNLALATGFTEPMRVSITLASDWAFARHVETGTGNTKAAPGISLARPRLIVEHRLLPNEMEDATIAANYSQGPLSQLVYDYETETYEYDTGKGDGVVNDEISHEIKSTAVATDIYVFVELKTATAVAGGLHGDTASARNMGMGDIPLPVDYVSFTASGQNICDQIDGEYLGLFGRRTLKDGFFGTCPGGGFGNGVKEGDAGDRIPDCGNPCFVYRLQFGLDNSKQYDSNGISLRELNAPTVTVRLAKHNGGWNKYHGPNQNWSVNNKQYRMYTVIRKLGLQTTDSSSGRVVSTLSN